MKVLSLFDGISCGRVALDRAGVKYSCYHASEIDESAILCATTNYPDTVELGDITKLYFNKGDYDLIIGGSPCQDLSSCGSHKGLQGDRSGLFYEYVRILKEVNPRYFLLENNASMSKVNYRLMCDAMGCDAYLINSVDFSAQNRRRYYWTNIPVNKYTPKVTFLKDIVQFGVEHKDITERVERYLSSDYAGRKIQTTVRDGVKNLWETSRTITASSHDFGSNGSLIIKIGDRYVRPTQTEFERLQTLPDNYTSMLPFKKAVFAIGNGWTVDVIAHIFKGLKGERINNV